MFIEATQGTINGVNVGDIYFLMWFLHIKILVPQIFAHMYMYIALSYFVKGLGGMTITNQEMAYPKP